MEIINVWKATVIEVELYLGDFKHTDPIVWSQYVKYTNAIEVWLHAPRKISKNRYSESEFEAISNSGSS